MGQRTYEVSLTNALGCPADGDAGTQATSSSAATVTLEANKTYLLYATEDVHIVFTTGTGDATTSDMFFKKETYFYFSTTDTLDSLSVIRNSADGTLYYTKLTQNKI